MIERASSGARELSLAALCFLLCACGEEPEVAEPPRAEPPLDSAPHVVDPPPAELRDVSGMVTLAGARARRGEPVEAEQAIEVSEGGSAVLQLRDGGRITLDDGARAWVVDESAAQLLLVRGGAHAVQPPAGSSPRPPLRLVTPAATVEIGQSGEAYVATYEGGRAARVWPAMREALGSVEWNREAQLDAALALGIEVGAVEGLTLNRSTTANVVLLGRGASFPPEPGQAVVSIAPLPMQLASEQSARVCEQIIARLMPVPTSDIEHEGAIENGPLPGCERLATADANGERVVTYAALIFSSQTPILVTGSVDADELARWRPRFSAAARAIRPRAE